MFVFMRENKTDIMHCDFRHPKFSLFCIIWQLIASCPSSQSWRYFFMCIGDYIVFSPHARNGNRSADQKQRDRMSFDEGP